MIKMKWTKYYGYKERQLAEKIFLDGLQSRCHMEQEFRFAAMYLLELQPKVEVAELQDQMYEFIRRVLPEEKFCKNKWVLPVTQAVKYAMSPRTHLIQVDKVPMMKSELAWVDSLEVEESVKRMVYGIIAMQKFRYLRFKETGVEIDMAILPNKVIDTMPRACGIKRDRNFDVTLDIMRPMADAGLIRMLTSPKEPFVITFADKIAWEGEESIEITDMTQIGMYWDYLHGSEKVGFCSICKAPFKRTTANRKLCDCHLHGDDRPVNVLFWCARCGRPSSRLAKATQQIRCKRCQYKILRWKRTKTYWRAQERAQGKAKRAVPANPDGARV